MAYYITNIKNNKEYGEIFDKFSIKLKLNIENLLNLCYNQSQKQVKFTKCTQFVTVTLCASICFLLKYFGKEVILWRKRNLSVE